MTDMQKKDSRNQPIQVGDVVVWWKTLPGGDYVYPVKATIVAFTAKRVKIAAIDEGERVIRYVKPSSLQKQS